MLNITTPTIPPMKNEITEPAAYKQLLVDPLRGMASASNTNIDSIKPIKSVRTNIYPITNSTCTSNQPSIELQNLK